MWNMSTTLPQALRRTALDAATTGDGRYRCAGCRRKFARSHVQIDHVIPEVDRPDLHLDPSNHQVLCAPPGSAGCHRAKTSAEARQRARRARRAAWSPASLVLPLLGCYVLLALALVAYTLVTGRDPAELVNPAVAAWPWVLIGVAGLLVAKPVVQVSRWWVTSATKEPSTRAKTATPAPDPALDAVKLQARIEAAAREHIGGTRGAVAVSDLAIDDGRLVGFTITYEGTGATDHELEWRVAFMDRLAAKLDDGRWLDVWQTGHDRVKVRRRSDIAGYVPHPGFAADKPWNVIPVAPECSFDLLVTSHILVVGATNAGKTALMRSIVASFIHSARAGQAQVWIGDPKLIEMLGFDGSAGIDRLATADAELYALAIDAEEEMMRRYADHKENGTSLEDFPPLLILIDEYERYVDRVESYFAEHLKKKAGQKCRATAAIKSLLMLARKCRIHVVLGTQRPDAAWFGGAARDNLQGRALVGTATAELSRMCFGVSTHGRDVPTTLKGRTTFQIGEGKPFEQQAYWTPDAHDLRKGYEEEDRAILDLVAA